MRMKENIEDPGLTQPTTTTTSPIIPLRTILENFLNLLESYETKRLDGVDLYEKEFQELKQFSESLKNDESFQSKEGEKSVNRKKNRYKDILPFDYTRVTLSDYGDIPGSGYTNANFIKGASGSSAYIACQGPLPHTVNDFWRMVVECEVQVIVMACMEQESGKHKCENYWVDQDGVEREFGSVTVRLKKCKEVCPDFLVRTMRIQFPNNKGGMEERNVCQFHYSAWPDHGVPSRVRPLLDMVRLIRDCQASETLPVLVHCSAGCGRTGTICAIDFVWGLLRLGKLTPDFSLFNLVKDMRRQRIAMVQTKDQYILVHRAVKELFKEQLRLIEDHPYANVDQNGIPHSLKNNDLEEPMYETIDVSPTLSENNNTIRIKWESRTERSSPDLPQRSRTIWPVNNEITAATTNSPPTSEERSGSSDGDLDEKRSLRDDEALAKTKDAHDGHGHTSIQSRLALLRKPSIVKLKALFDKTSGKKSNKFPTNLSRAKSDVSSSSRFYEFATDFQKDKVPEQNPDHNKDQTRSKEFRDGKPPVAAKPLLIKRSKSLKFQQELEPSTTIVQTTINKPHYASIENGVLMAETQPTQSMKSNVIVRNDYSTLGESSVGSSENSMTSPSGKFVVKQNRPQGGIFSTDFRSQLSERPNRSGPETKINFTLSKEFEDTLTERPRDKDNYRKIRKYDTVGPRNWISSALSRSQSHVWTDRIFTDDKNSRGNQGQSKMSTVLLPGEGGQYTPNTFNRFSPNENVHLKENGGLNGNSFVGTPLIGRPTPLRREAVKDNHYVNSSMINQMRSKKDEATQGQGCGNFGLSQFGTHSDGSSTPGTPKTSLSGTPTQSLDHLIGRNYNQSKQGLVHGGGGRTNNPTLPNSIFKSSLSSTPSGSDEKLEVASLPREVNGENGGGYFGGGFPGYLGQTVTITHNLGPTPISSGLRERRNSFRQAVWKEAPSEVKASCDSNNIQQVPLVLNHNKTENGQSKVRKDYEPIWVNGKGHNHNGPSTNWGHPPPPSQSKQMSFPIRGTMAMEETPYQKRVDEIQNLLEELKAPVVRTEGVKNVKIPETFPKSGQSNGIRPQMSFKETNRSQFKLPPHNNPNYPRNPDSNISCFPFRKPCSLESLTGQAFSSSGSTGYEPLSAARTVHRNSPQCDNQQRNGKHLGKNEYVSLLQCRSIRDKYSPDDRVLGSSGSGIEFEGSPHPSNSNNGIRNFKSHPIPPPRTKSKRGLGNCPEPSREAYGSSGRYPETLGSTQGASKLTPHNTSSNEGQLNLERTTSNSSNDTNVPSSRTLMKAIGLFQANMRSRFAHWNESKGHRRGRLLNGNSVHPEPTVVKHEENERFATPEAIGQSTSERFFAPTASTSVSPPTHTTRTTKYQYL